MTDTEGQPSWLIAGFTANGHELEVLYWSNALGWTSREEADVFPEVERQFCALPLGGYWVPADT